ncbi:hypothetical protein ACHAXM_000433 [Skeletonema potamos]
MSNDKDDNTKDPAVDNDEDEDEDYVPGQDPDEGVPSDDDENDIAATLEEDSGPLLSITKQKAVDDAFNDLFGYNYTKSAAAKPQSKLPVKSKSAMQKQKNILSSIFGKSSCSKLLSTSKVTAALARPKASSGGMMRLEKRVIKEVKRFAGQEICVEKVVMVPIFTNSGSGGDGKPKSSTNEHSNTNNVTAATAASTAKGLDNLLQEMSRPEKLSTISKTSTDWDLFKSKNADEALKEQLESRAQGNDAFLVKKDFLDRVDHRRFELEKQERDRERASRGK